MQSAALLTPTEFLEEEIDMDNLSTVRYSHTNMDHSLTGKLVECYREVFAGRPWNEWLKCQKCNQYWGTKHIADLVVMKFRHCDTPLVDYWSRELVLTDILHEITPDASCWLEMTPWKVVGFCWGYPITASNLQEKLAGNIELSEGVPFKIDLGRDSNELIAYQDEVGVLTQYQGRKIAKGLVRHRLEDFLARGLKFGVVRTRQLPESSVTFNWYTQKLGYRILAEYPGNDGRVILGRELDGLRNLLRN